MRWWPLTARGTGALVLAAGSFAGASLWGSVGLLGFGVLLTSLVAVCAVSLAVTRRRLGVRRTVVPLVEVGATVRVTARVSMTSVLPTSAGSWSDRLPPAIAGSPGGDFPAGRATRGGAGTASFSYDVRALRRGAHSIGPFVVVGHDPFGICRHRTVAAATTSVLVAPVVQPLAPWSHGSGGGALDSAEAVSTTDSGQGTDDLLARAYEPGDSMRRIHWRASAHHDTLMVRQEEPESRPAATVVLDDSPVRWASPTFRLGVDPGFERAVSACASATRALLADGYAVRVRHADGTDLADLRNRGDRAAWSHLLEALAVLGLGSGEPAASFVAPPRTAGARLIVLITGALGADDADWLATVRAQGSHAVLLTTGTARAVREAAVLAGWHAASLDDGLAEAWRAVSPKRTPLMGANHGGR